MSERGDSDAECLVESVDDERHQPRVGRAAVQQRCGDQVGSAVTQHVGSPSGRQDVRRHDDPVPVRAGDVDRVGQGCVAAADGADMDRSAPHGAEEPGGPGVAVDRRIVV